jgi:hypothetical protein
MTSLQFPGVELSRNVPMPRKPTLIRYPFVPKSTALLLPGQFWAIPLDCGRYGCGRVLSLKVDDRGRVARRLFLAGLMEWTGVRPPDAKDLEGKRIIWPGFAHIKTILETGGMILGLRDLALDGNEPGLFFDPCVGGVLQGGIFLREATRVDERCLPRLGGHGYMVLKIGAEKLASGSL